jgi:hypothetical protein
MSSAEPTAGQYLRQLEIANLAVNEQGQRDARPDSANPAVRRFERVYQELNGRLPEWADVDQLRQAWIDSTGRYASEWDNRPLNDVASDLAVGASLDEQGNSTLDDLLTCKTADYRPSTELERIIFELSNPRVDSAGNPGDAIEIPNPTDEHRRAWLPIVKDSIGRIPELADLSPEKLRRWLWDNHKVPPTVDLGCEDLLLYLDRDRDGASAPPIMSRTESTTQALLGLQLFLINCEAVWGAASTYAPPSNPSFPEANHEIAEEHAWQFVCDARPGLLGLIEVSNRLRRFAESGGDERISALSAWGFFSRFASSLDSISPVPLTSPKNRKAWRVQWTRLAREIRESGPEPKWGQWQAELEEKRMRLSGELPPSTVKQDQGVGAEPGCGPQIANVMLDLWIAFGSPEPDCYTGRIADKPNKVKLSTLREWPEIRDGIHKRIGQERSAGRIWECLVRIGEEHGKRRGDDLLSTSLSDAILWFSNKEAGATGATPSPLEAIEAVKRRVYGDAYAGPAGFVPESDPSRTLLRVFTNGLADDRIERASRVLSDDELTANEKLTRIDGLIPFPPTASAEQLGEMLGVSKQAVLKTEWWIQKRKGEKNNEIGRRRAGHNRRAKDYESPDPKTDEE